MEGILAVQKSLGLKGSVYTFHLKLYPYIARDVFVTRCGRVGYWPRMVALPESIGTRNEVRCRSPCRIKWV